MLCGLRAGWGRRRAADAAAGPGPRALGGEPQAEAAAAGGGAGAGTLAGGGGGWDEPGGRLWGQIASRGEAAEWGAERRRRPPGSAMAAPRDPLSGYLQQPPLSDPGSNSERSTDSPVPGSEEDSAGPPRAPHSPEWGEERFRVDRKKLEAMLQAAAEGKGKSGEDFFQK
ncbi:AT-rich interactive domain-containing protein 1B-like, partial [Apteryx mantelli]|uniref:AT-rich interactive domain-containing protein 1B-like n=1 Tax=Apteryx mantelli TaxID=2696672 RepID=A0ABM4G7S9_9AVES